MGALSFRGCPLDVLGAGVGLGQVSFTSSCSISDPEEESVRFLLLEEAARFTGTVGLVGVSESEEERFLFFFLHFKRFYPVKCGCVATRLIASQGWACIHASAAGAPGKAIATSQVQGRLAVEAIPRQVALERTCSWQGIRKFYWDFSPGYRVWVRIPRRR